VGCQPGPGSNPAGTPPRIPARAPSAAGPRRYRVHVAKRLDLPFDPIARAAEIWEQRFGPAEAMAAVTSIMRAQQLLQAELDGLLRPHGLTFARYEALILLTFSRRGALPLRVIGERLMVHPTSVTNIIDRLEEQGMVVRRPNPRDGRGTLAEIAARGRKTAEQATEDLMTARFGMGGYDTGELGQVFTLLRGLRLAAGDFVVEPGETHDHDLDVVRTTPTS
jgi:DNA-binding MarR family transcriptional regulator